MAQALRTDWLVQEAPQETAAPTFRTRRRLSPAVLTALALGALPVLVTLIVTVLLSYVRLHAQIADYENRRDQLQQRSAQLDNECIELNLALERMATETRLAKVTEEKTLTLPDPTRLSYLPGADDYPTVAKAAPVKAGAKQTGSGGQLVAMLGTAWQTLGGGGTRQARVNE